MRQLFPSHSLVRTGTCLLLAALACSPTTQAQAPTASTETMPPPANWRNIKDGAGGYPAGPMLEIAVRHTHSDKLEMFKWRSEFIAMLSAQPGPLIEREWHSLSGIPENTGAGTWTGMTWWENQQRWQDMANMVFPSPVAGNWLKTIDMTMLFVKPLDSDFHLSTLAQSGTEVLELGLLVFPATGSEADVDREPAAAKAYLEALRRNGVEVHRFALYPNLSGQVAPYTVAYNKNGPPAAKGEYWYVYMASYSSPELRTRLHTSGEVRQSFEALRNATVQEHSDIQVMTRTTSEVCIKKSTGQCSLDPDECHVGAMGSGDTLARSCGERPQACETSFGVCSMLSPGTCSAVGGKQVDHCGGGMR